MAVEQCLVLVKPDGMIKHLTGDIISKLSETGLKIVGSKLFRYLESLQKSTTSI
jgi:nucleoside-diphosphate kinase